MRIIATDDDRVLSFLERVTILCRMPSNSLRHSLSLVRVAWMSGAMWMYITTGAVLTRYAQSIGLPNFGFGLLAALPFICSLAQLPSSLFLER